MNAPLEASTVRGLEFFVLARRCSGWQTLQSIAGEDTRFQKGLTLGVLEHELPCELRHMALDAQGREVLLGVTATGSYAEIAQLRRLFAVEPIQLHPEESPDVVEVWI